MTCGRGPWMAGLGPLVALALACAVDGSGGPTPAERRIESLVATVDALEAEPGRAEVFVAEAFGPDMLAAGSAAEHVEILRGIAARSGGLELVEVALGEKGMATARVRTRLDGTPLVIEIAVEPDPPHRIAGIDIGRAGAERSAAPGDEGAAGPVDWEAELGALLDELVERDAFSGAVLVTERGRTLLARAEGLADRDRGVPVAMDTRFNIASLGKMLTAVAVAQLVEAGHVGFDDPVDRHLPGLLDAEGGRRVTVGHLLSHTAGLGDFMQHPTFDSVRVTARSAGDFVPLVRGARPAFEPGTSWAYSNSGYVVLGALVEAVSGRTYEAYVREHVLAPAGMESTGFDAPARNGAGHAVGYVREVGAGGLEVRDNRTLLIPGGPAGGAYATAADLVRFSEALFSGGLVDETLLREMLSPKPGSPDYGYGFRLRDEGRVVGHRGGFPGASALLEIHLERGLVVVVLANLDPGARSVSEWLEDRLGG